MNRFGCARYILIDIIVGAYYAAQLGIGLKLKDTPSRTFLVHLLDLLEKLKAEIGANDAIYDDAASAAYVENFAVKIFAMADREDRKGAATRCVLPILNVTRL